jgi:Arc/MetJ-type ribon-helix-helix transcriptional regulator
MSKNKEKTKWSIPVSKTLDDAVERAIDLDLHSTKSDFVRDAVRKRLEEMGFKNVPFTEATQNVK